MYLSFQAGREQYYDGIEDYYSKIPRHNAGNAAYYDYRGELVIAGKHGEGNTESIALDPHKPVPCYKITSNRVDVWSKNL